MTKTLLASVAIAAFVLAGCAKEEKMMKDPAPAAEAPAAAAEPAPAAEAPAAEASADPMMDLCHSKGGSVNEWPGEGGATKTCRAGDGSEYPLAYLSSYEAFQ